MTNIPIITLWQPWASLVAFRLKRYETRSWSTSYLGKIFIHAAARKVDKGALLELVRQDVDIPEGFEIRLGCVIACADLVAVKLMVSDAEYELALPVYRDGMIRISDQTKQELATGYWKPGRFAWQLNNVQRIDPPIFIKGHQKLWHSEYVNDKYQEGLISRTHLRNFKSVVC